MHHRHPYTRALRNERKRHRTHHWRTTLHRTHTLLHHLWTLTTTATTLYTAYDITTTWWPSQ